MQTLTTEQVAERLNISKRTLELWREKVPTPGPTFIRIGRKVAYPLDELVEWVQQRVTLTDQPDTPPAGLVGLLPPEVQAELAQQQRAHQW